MDCSRVLYFLGVLAAGTDGNGELLEKLYKRALDSDDRIGGVRELMDSCGFYHEPGRILLEQGRALLSRVYADPAGALGLMQELINLSDRMDMELKNSAELMGSPLPFSGSADVIRTRDLEGYMEALKAVASVSVYLIAMYAGIGAVRDLEWNDEWGVQDRIFFVNTRFLPAVMRLAPPREGFVMTRGKLGGRALFTGEGFFLSRAGRGYVEDLIRGLECEPLCGNSYLNKRAWETREPGIPLCFGYGRLLSAGPGEALGLLKEPVSESLRCPGEAETRRPLPGPMPLMRALSERRHFCITGEELALAMRRWQSAYEFGLRRSRGQCPLCGAPARKGRLSCGGHFVRG